VILNADVESKLFTRRMKPYHAIRSAYNSNFPSRVLFSTYAIDKEN
jgi:hypothetical protein